MQNVNRTKHKKIKETSAGYVIIKIVQTILKSYNQPEEKRQHDKTTKREDSKMAARGRKQKACFLK
jgi:hypothetical protein